MIKYLESDFVWKIAVAKGYSFPMWRKNRKKNKRQEKRKNHACEKKNIYIYYACEQTHKIVSKPNVSINIVGQAEA